MPRDYKPNCLWNFGDYDPTRRECQVCWQGILCTEEAQRLDNYWDELARYEWELINAGLWEEPYHGDHKL